MWVKDVWQRARSGDGPNPVGVGAVLGVFESTAFFASSRVPSSAVVIPSVLAGAGVALAIFGQKEKDPGPKGPRSSGGSGRRQRQPVVVRRREKR